MIPKQGASSMRKLTILLGGALVLAACTSRSVEPPPPPAPMHDPNDPLFAPGFLAQAGSGDQFEIQSSQLALTASSNAAVRAFANQMIADHTRLSQQMAAAASSAGITPPPPALLPAQQAMLDQLRAAGTGPSFDMAYQQAQVTAHQGALTLFQNYAASGDNAAIKTAASGAIPTIQMHLQQAQALNVAAPPPPPPPVRQPGERG
jgi:putative membrane protein